MNDIYSLGPLEKNIMDIIWKKREASVNDVLKILRKGREIAYTTVMTIMYRLVEKGLLKRTKDGKAYRYTPYYSRKQIVHNSVKSVISSLVNQFGREAVVAFTDELEKIHK